MTHHLSTLCTRCLRGLGLSTLVLVLAGAPAAGAAAARTRELVSSTCPLPLVHDRYAGFHIGVPTGWALSSAHGLIVVSKDTAGTELALVYAAVLTTGMTPASFFATVSTALQQQIAAAGNAMRVHLTSTPGQLPHATLTGRAGTVAETGHAEVLLVPARTALSAEQVVYAAYWAPSTRLVHDRSVLAGIGHCYGPEAGTLYQLYHDQNFTLVLPEGWTVTVAGQDLIDLKGDNNHAAVSYELALVPASVGATTPLGFLQYVLSASHIQIGRVLGSTNAACTHTLGGPLPLLRVDFLD